MDKNMSLLINCFLVVGIGKAVNPEVDAQVSIIGIATNNEQAELLIGQDYMGMINSISLNPMTNPVTREYKEEGDTFPSSYHIPSYSWYVIEIPLNSLVNFTL